MIGVLEESIGIKHMSSAIVAMVSVVQGGAVSGHPGLVVNAFIVFISVMMLRMMMGRMMAVMSGDMEGHAAVAAVAAVVDGAAVAAAVVEGAVVADAVIGEGWCHRQK